jgi:DNA processing protein
MTGLDRTVAGANAWLALALVEGLTARKAFELARVYGSPEAVLAAPAAALERHGLGPAVAARLAGWAERATRERDALARAHGLAITWADPGYPARLRTIPDPPVALFVRGSLEAADDLAVAVVGARRAGEYGRRIAGDLARGLAQAGITVVSGLAAGIDAAGHRGALEAGGRTLAVMGTGIDRVYPAWHRDLAREIATQGAILTEFPCGTLPRQFHFPQRNRIIAGLTVGTVVVEAAERSGSLITAEYAMEQGREVFAVPGPVGTSHHRGCHRLIQQGATLVTSVDDILEAVAPALRGRVAKARAAAERAVLSPGEAQLLDAVGEGALHVDVVAGRAALPAGVVLETLLALELRGLVEQRPGMRFVRRRAA